jgi:hypothetical protein
MSDLPVSPSELYGVTLVRTGLLMPGQRWPTGDGGFYISAEEYDGIVARLSDAHKSQDQHDAMGRLQRLAQCRKCSTKRYDPGDKSDCPHGTP